MFTKSRPVPQEQIVYVLYLLSLEGMQCANKKNYIFILCMIG